MMNAIQGIGSAIGISSAPTLGQATAPRAEAGAGAEAATGASVSPRALFLSQLQEAAKNDPAGAARMLTGLAGSFRDQAAQGASDAADRLKWADTLQKAADTGDLSGLFSRLGGGGTNPPQAVHAYNPMGAVAVTRSSW